MSERKINEVNTEEKLAFTMPSGSRLKPNGLNDERDIPLRLYSHLIAPIRPGGAIQKLFSPCFRETSNEVAERVSLHVKHYTLNVV